MPLALEQESMAVFHHPELDRHEQVMFVRDPFAGQELAERRG
jgi:hypothetical protein